MTALASPAYVAEQIADELALLPLLGWKNVRAPSEITPNCWIMGTHFFANGHTARNASTFCPRPRRSNDAFELIARCQMMVSCTQRSVSVMCPEMPLHFEGFAEHPTELDAIRAAMCKAAIAYLSKERGA